MKTKNKLLIAAFILAISFVVLPEFADAQCAMCKAVAESNQNAKGEQHFGANLNNAILYLMAVPYIILVFLAFLFFKKQIIERLGKVFNFSAKNIG